MKKTLTTHEIAAELLNDNCARWSRAGAYALAEHLQQMEDETGEELELDIVAIRCDWSEYESLQAWAADYFAADWRDELGAVDCGEEETAEKIREYIQDHGQLVEFNAGVIVSQF